MIDPEERYNDYKDALDELEAMKRHGEAFYATIDQYLTELVFDWWPELLPFRSEIAERMEELTDRAAFDAMDCLDCVEACERKGKTITKRAGLPKPLTEADAEERAIRFSHRFPDMTLEECREVVREDFEWELRVDQIQHKIHQTVKRGMTEFYMDHIMEMEPDYLLAFDEYLYWISAAQFGEGIRSLVYDYTHEEIDWEEEIDGD